MDKQVINRQILNKAIRELCQDNNDIYAQVNGIFTDTQIDKNPKYFLNIGYTTKDNLVEIGGEATFIQFGDNKGFQDLIVSTLSKQYQFANPFNLPATQIKNDQFAFVYDQDFTVRFIDNPNIKLSMKYVQFNEFDHVKKNSYNVINQLLNFLVNHQYNLNTYIEIPDTDISTKHIANVLFELFWQYQCIQKNYTINPKKQKLNVTLVFNSVDSKISFQQEIENIYECYGSYSDIDMLRQDRYNDSLFLDFSRSSDIAQMLLQQDFQTPETFNFEYILKHQTALKISTFVKILLEEYMFRRRFLRHV